MKRIIKWITDFFSDEKVEEKKVVEEKTPFEERRELVNEQFKHLDQDYSYVKDNTARKEEILEGITKGTFVLERIMERERLSAEEEFKLRLYEDIRKFIEKYFEDETVKLRQEISVLEDKLERKERELERLKEGEIKRQKELLAYK
jgi:hypothetical protein